MKLIEDKIKYIIIFYYINNLIKLNIFSLLFYCLLYFIFSEVILIFI